MIPTLPYIVFVAALALVCAAGDAKRIARLSRIRHVLAWCVRASTVAAAAFIVACFLPSWWCVLPLLVLGAFLFSLVFRLRLNALRGKHWYYLGKGAYYDRFFLWVAVQPKEPKDGIDVPAWAAYGLAMKRYFRRSGLIATVSEITLSVLSLVVLGAIVNQHIQP